ncbi:hypothetical protein GGD63_007947 [Bradyrhizobium sp. cir1]|uniref:hypothetical protein n=1 Tax=Bradyrhizobium sp. cir1 TaxID=1445730 RepID=UPI0016062907|nr:hypothetical protein [Bradyrhizobium sp. cir1]MBB4375103.1 hypothetical protein [Bradyrhizobium sp. cir1]
MSSAGHIDPQKLADLRKREVYRLIFEGAGQIAPVTAGLAALLRFTHPSELQKALDVQRLALVDTAADHEARLVALEKLFAPRLAISSGALIVGRDACLRSSAAFSEYITYTDLEAFTALPKREWEEVLAELKQQKLARPENGRMMLLWRFFCLFDPLFNGTDPVGDAAMLAGRLADCADIDSASAFVAAPNLAPRRFNPAMMFLSKASGERVKRTINGEWRCLGELSGDDRYRLRNVQSNSTQIALDLMRDLSR